MTKYQELLQGGPVLFEYDAKALIYMIGMVKEGSELATQCLVAMFNNNEYETSNDEDAVHIEALQQVQQKLLDVVLEFLSRCKCNKEFAKVIKNRKVGSVGGDLKSPSTWIELLISVSSISKDCHSQIIDNIGPLVSCMCNDTKRKFFGSNRHWHESILPFATLIEKLLLVEENFSKLSQHEGLFEKIIQWWFWKSHRPDITKEAESYRITVSTFDDYFFSPGNPEEMDEGFAPIVYLLCLWVVAILSIYAFMGGETVSLSAIELEQIETFLDNEIAFMVLEKVHAFEYERSETIFNDFDDVDVSYDFLSAGETISSVSNVGEDAVFHLIRCTRGSSDAKTWLEKLGTIPIVSRAYDPNCKVSLVGGVVRHIKKYGDSSYLSLLDDLIGYADCVDKDVITEMIGLGFDFDSSNYTSADADHVLRVISAMIMQSFEGGIEQPSDTRVAYAICAGLFEMVTNIITRFGDDQKSCERLCSTINSIMHNVYLLSFHKKTSKALSNKRNEIVYDLCRLEKHMIIVDDAGSISIFGISSGCEMTVRIVQSILDVTSTNCHYCNKFIERSEMKKCAACKRMCYCSEECQRNDWQIGTHEQECKNGKYLIPSYRTPEHNTSKRKDIEDNMLFSDIFNKHTEEVGQLLVAQDEESRSKSIVLLDLRQWPLIPKVVVGADYFTTPEDRAWFDRRSDQGQNCSDDKSTICIFSSPIFNGKENENMIIYQIYTLTRVK